nr:MAG: nonstructural protein [Microvirus sp.]
MMNPFSKLAPTTKQVDAEIFTIYDSKSKSYEMPSFSANGDTVKRGILNMFRDPSQSQNKFLVNAEDYSVFKIGSFNKTTGELEVQHPEHIVNLHDLRALAGPTAPIPQQMNPSFSMERDERL